MVIKETEGVGLWYLTPLSTIFQLYHDGKKKKKKKKVTDVNIR
jgi:hypothetical protein